MPAPAEKRQYPEGKLQRATNDLFTAILDPSVIWFHIPNQGDINRQRGAILRGMGLKAGVYDWYLCWPGPRCHNTGWIEMKSPTGTLSDSQKLFRRHVESLGHETAEARSIQTVLEILDRWRVPHRRVS